LAPVFKNQGVRMMDSNRAMQTFESMLSQNDNHQILVMPVDWNQYTEINGTQIQFQNLITQTDSVAPSTQKTAIIGDELHQAMESERWDMLQTHVQQITSSFLHISDPSTLPLRKRLFEIGLDSLGAVELKNRLARILGVELRSTLLFDYPTVEDLVEHIGSQVFKWTHLNEVPTHEKSGAEDIFVLTDDISDDDLAALLMKELGDE
jgi:acyl carrier protein